MELGLRLNVHVHGPGATAAGRFLLILRIKATINYIGFMRFLLSGWFANCVALVGFAHHPGKVVFSREFLPNARRKWHQSFPFCIQWISLALRLWPRGQGRCICIRLLSSFPLVHRPVAWHRVRYLRNGSPRGRQVTLIFLSLTVLFIFQYRDRLMKASAYFCPGDPPMLLA